MAASSWDQIASEHCYPKLMAHWSSISQSLPTYHLFQPKEREELGEGLYKVHEKRDIKEKDEESSRYDEINILSHVLWPIYYIIEVIITVCSL